MTGDIPGGMPEMMRRGSADHGRRNPFHVRHTDPCAAGRLGVIVGAAFIRTGCYAMSLALSKVGERYARMPASDIHINKRYQDHGRTMRLVMSRD